MRDKNKLNYIKQNIVNNPQINKGTAFNPQERIKLNLLGKLPYKTETLTSQVKRTYLQFKNQPDDHQKNLFLHQLHHINQTLFYRLVSENLAEMVPIIYTPQVAKNCSSFSDEFLFSHGGYISYPERKNLKKILDNIIASNVDVIVITDGERVLGIGDQGVGGMAISVGKLMLYTLLGNVNPNKTLPLVLDVGTNNPQHLNNPNYLGWRHKRITGKKYLDFVNKFVTVLKQKVPQVLLQWEDFGKNNAWKLLTLYRQKICSFNDDIQGTAAVALAGLLAAVKASKHKLAEQKIVIFGAGTAAIGIVTLLISYLQKIGINKKDFSKNIWLVDKDGLITDKLAKIDAIQKPYARKISELKNWRVKNSENISLFETVKNVKPTVLLGCSTVAGAFTQKIVKEMARHTKRPIIFPLSNPTINAEATPNNLIKWTKGRALIATGSPFPAVIYKNKKIGIAQCNNALIFPGIGLGVIASKAQEVTDEMFLEAAVTLYKKSPALKNNSAPLLPSINEVPKISKLIAKKIATIALKNKLSRYNPKTNLDKLIQQNIWKPQY